MKKIKVLIVDDSSVIRNILSTELAKFKEIEVVGSAPDPYIARDKIISLKPDVLTLDIEMPRMDGLTFLEKLMKHFPLPVVILSSLADRGCDLALKAMEAGAVDVIQKPDLDVSHKLNEMMIMLVEKIKGAFAARYKYISRTKQEQEIAKKKTVFSASSAMMKTTDKIIAIGASTGGTEAIREIIPGFPANFPGTVIVQHMPENFTRSFAESLNKISRVEVREAADNDTVQPGLVLIARGNYHMLLKRSGARYYVSVKQGSLVCNQRPAVDVLFNSVSKYAGTNAIGVLLTGMGKDGAKGLLNMKNSGAYTIAQDEKSSVVFGMPKEAIEIGGVVDVTPLSNILEKIIRKL